jgi:hypothetical protein
MRFYRIAAYRKAEDRKAEAARYRQMTEEMAGALRTNIPSIVRAQAARESNIPTVDLSLCEYNKHAKFLKLASEYMGMPPQFFVKSHHTGKEVRFVEIGPEDKLYDEDGWDGEQKIYRPVGVVPNVDYMVIYHAW